MTEEKTVSALPHAIRFGIVGGLLCVVVSVVLYIADLQFESWAKWISSLVMVLTIVLGLRAVREEHPGMEVGFGTLFGAGMLITFIIAVMTIVYFYIYLYAIDPDFIQSTIEVSRQKMVENNLSEAQIEKAMEISKKIMTPGLMGGIALLTTLILGGIFSLIAAALFKQEK